MARTRIDEISKSERADGASSPKEPKAQSMSHTIASADDDMIAGKLLRWSGLQGMWLDSELDRWFDFVRDVAEHCPSLEIEKEEWDGEAPGRSGTWHSVSTDDDDKARLELKTRVAELVRSNESTSQSIGGRKRPKNE